MTGTKTGASGLTAYVGDEYHAVQTSQRMIGHEYVPSVRGRPFPGKMNPVADIKVFEDMGGEFYAGVFTVLQKQTVYLVLMDGLLDVIEHETRQTVRQFLTFAADDFLYINRQDVVF